MEVIYTDYYVIVSLIRAHEKMSENSLNVIIET